MAEPMVNNKQVNFWRGDETPPTIYHIWIKDNSKMLLYDGNKWVVFLDNIEIVDSIKEILERLDGLESNTVNGKLITTNPVLQGTDINVNANGNFILGNNTIAQAMQRLDGLLTTQIIE